MNKIILLFSLFCCINISFSQSATAAVTSHIHAPKTEGTFQFDSPSGTILFWRIDFIEELYPEIEARRQQSEPVYWEYNNDMTIIIFSRDFITSEDFSPLESPYKGVKNPE